MFAMLCVFLGQSLVSSMLLLANSLKVGCEPFGYLAVSVPLLSSLSISNKYSSVAGDFDRRVLSKFVVTSFSTQYAFHISFHLTPDIFRCCGFYLEKTG